MAITDPSVGRVNFGVYKEEDKGGGCHFYKTPDLATIPRTDDGLFEADFCGFAWLLVKKGVFESIPYPWFKPLVREVNGVYNFPSEDISWCYEAKKYGWKIYVDPEAKIGHEKRTTLRIPKQKPV